MYGFRKKYQRNIIKEEAISNNDNPTKLVEFNITKEPEKNFKNRFRNMPRNLSNINNFKNNNKIDEDIKIKKNSNLKEDGGPNNDKNSNYKIDKMSLSYKKIHKIIPFKEKNLEEKEQNKNNINIFRYDSKKGTIENEFDKDNNKRRNYKFRYEKNNINNKLEKENKNNNDTCENNKIGEDKYETPYIRKYFNKHKDNDISSGGNKVKNNSVNKNNKVNPNIKRINNEIDDKGKNNIYNNELFDRLKNELNEIERINAERKLKGNMLQLVNEVVRNNFDFKENIFFRNLDNTSKKIGNMDNIHKRSISHTFKEIKIDDILK